MYEYQGFADDSLFNRKPVKRLYGWGDMRKSGNTRDKACQAILDILKPYDILGRINCETENCNNPDNY